MIVVGRAFGEKAHYEANRPALAIAGIAGGIEDIIVNSVAFTYAWHSRS